MTARLTLPEHYMHDTPQHPLPRGHHMTACLRTNGAERHIVPFLLYLPFLSFPYLPFLSSGKGKEERERKARKVQMA